jgi:MFS transporter, DHA2 family, glioxin efflux transporter
MILLWLTSRPALLTIVSGVGITVTGHYIPYLVVGSVAGTIGSGLIHTLKLGSPSSHWIGYQALTGIGYGLAIQIPIIVAQAIVEPADISSITAIMIFFQTISGAIFVSAGQSLFANKLVQTVAKLVPDVQPSFVVATGATELRRVFSAAQLPGIIASFMAGLKNAYAMGIALSGMAVIVAVLAAVIDRRRLNQTGKPSAGDAA